MTLIRRAVLTGGAACTLAAAVSLAVIASSLGRMAVPASAPAAGVSAGTVVVLDPGHGGEDGGAVSASGVAESGINLDISMRVRDLLRLMGQPVILTREADVSIGDPDLPTIRARKASDIRRRVEIVNGTDHAALLSIHQNSLPSSPSTHGAQVFWNRDGQALAESIQAALNEQVNAGNGKQAKEIDRSVYLTAHVTAPAALVECGFLSNAQETELLQNAAWQTRLAAAIAAGYLRYGENGT